MAARVSRISADGEPEADEALAVRASRGDHDAFDLLHARYRDAVARFCNRRLGDPDRALDASAIVFSRAWSGIGRFRGEREVSFRAWLFTIANRAVTDEYRKRRLKPLDHAQSMIETNVRYLPDAWAEIAERRARLSAALAQLPEEQRRIVELRLSGLNGVEISHVLGRTHSAIKSSQFRAYNRLRELLTAEGIEP